MNLCSWTFYSLLAFFLAPVRFRKILCSLQSSSNLQLLVCISDIFISIWYILCSWLLSTKPWTKVCLPNTIFPDQNSLLPFTDSLLCRKCGHDITAAANLDNRASRLALRQRNDTILGVQQCLIQLFKNPHGNFLTVPCFNFMCESIWVHVQSKLS